MGKLGINSLWTPIENPFSPGAGSPPPELSGRQDLLDKAHIALERLRRGKFEKSFFLVGLRGVGKTVLLNEIYQMAQKNAYHAVFFEAHGKQKPDKPVDATLTTGLISDQWQGFEQ